MTSYTTVKIGRAFEAHSLRFLNHHLNMSLRQVGGSGDEGIDLKGWWYVPSNAKRLESIVQSRDQALLGMPDRVEAKGKGRQDEKGLEKQMEEDGVQESPADWTAGFADDLAPVDVIRRLRVVGQCKAERVKLNARPVRELEGVMGHLHGREALRGPHQFSSRGRPLDRLPPESVAVLISQSGFSQQAMLRAWRSPSPMMLFHLPGGRPDQDGNLAVSKSGSDGGGEAVVEGAWWNPALAGPRGIFGGQVELRREILESEKTSRASGGANVKTQYRVWYQGKRMPRFGPELEAEVG